MDKLDQTLGPKATSLEQQISWAAVPNGSHRFSPMHMSTEGGTISAVLLNLKALFYSLCLFCCPKSAAAGVPMTLAEAEEAPKVSFRPSFTTRLHVTTVGGVAVVVAISMPIVNAVRVRPLPPSLGLLVSLPCNLFSIFWTENDSCLFIKTPLAFFAVLHIGFGSGHCGRGRRH